MKAGREHRVPLAPRAVEIIRAQQGTDTLFVFPGRQPGTALSNMAMLAVLRRMKRDDLTVHGFRSTFRDWVGERTVYQRELAEAALAHVVGGTEGAYARGDLFDKRRALMNDWAGACFSPI